MEQRHAIEIELLRQLSLANKKISDMQKQLRLMDLKNESLAAELVRIKNSENLNSGLCSFEFFEIKICIENSTEFNYIAILNDVHEQSAIVFFRQYLSKFDVYLGPFHSRLAIK